jgi:hypothetical protein
MANIFLYGGCVIRDSCNTIQEEVGISGYVARQSLISAMNGPSKLPKADLGSPFQSRMVNGDIESNLIPSLEKVASNTDLFVMDCHVERVGVFKLKDGSFVTSSSELSRAGVMKSQSSYTRVTLGSEQFLALWSQAAERFVNELDRVGLLEKTLVINAPWAERDEAGVPFASVGKMSVREKSESISSLTGVLSSHGVRVATMPPEVAIAPVDHQWGRGAYHFGAEAMQWAAAQMRNSIGS